MRNLHLIIFLLRTRKPGIKPENIHVTYSRSPNLRDMLVKAGLCSIPPQAFQTMLEPRYLTCPHRNTSQFISNQANHSYPIRGNLHCKSTNVVYVMTCNVCNIQYVGEISNTVNNRYRGHRSCIRTEKDHPVAIHYRSYNHTTDDYSITIADNEPDKNRRLRQEESWITLLDTLTPMTYGRW